jgi:hypothetical protein
MLLQLDMGRIPDRVLSMNEEAKKAVIQILSQSDIVWTKYGSDTKEALAERILKELEEIKLERPVY